MSSDAPVTASANRITALVVGTAFLALGAVGLAMTAGLPFTDPTGVLLLGVVSMNALQSMIHLAIGLVLVAAAIAGRTSSRLTTRVIGTLLLGLGLAGLFLSSTDVNVVAVNAAANLVHFAAAATLLAVGLGTDRAPARTR
jgi:hypothetical protein